MRAEKREEERWQDGKGMHEKLHIMKELNSEKESKQGIAMVTQGGLVKGVCVRHNAYTSCSVGNQLSASLCLGNYCRFLSHHLCDRGHWDLGQKHVHSPGQKV